MDYIYRTDDLDDLDVLVVGAHPDDAEILAGGTLASLEKRGCRTGVLDLSRGETGSRGTPEQRVAESQAAARVLKLACRGNLGCPDGDIANTREARLKLVRFIRRHRPRQVYTHHPRDPHPDHTNAFLLVRSAVHNAGLGKIAPGSEPYRPAYLFTFAPPHRQGPSFLVDITDTWETKREAILCHYSQVSPRKDGEPQTLLGQPAFLEILEAHQRSFGFMVGVRYAEAFFSYSLLVTDDPIRAFSRKTGRLL